MKGGKSDRAGEGVDEVSVAMDNHPPTLTSVNTLTGAVKNTPFTISYATLNANSVGLFDADGDTISFQIEGVSSGTLTMNGNPVVPQSTVLGPGQSLVWTPPSNSLGPLDAFTVRAWDGQALSASDVQVKVDVEANTVPTLNSGSPFLAAINEDDVTNNGTLVSDIIASSPGLFHRPGPGALQGLAEPYPSTITSGDMKGWGFP